MGLCVGFFGFEACILLQTGCVIRSRLIAQSWGEDNGDRFQVKRKRKDDEISSSEGKGLPANSSRRVFPKGQGG